MPQTACSFCHRRLHGAVLACYHIWYEDDVRCAWRQKACAKCAETAFVWFLACSVELTDDTVLEQTICGNCGGSLTPQSNVVSHKLYQGKSKREFESELCDDCLTLAAPKMIEGAERLQDRPALAGIGGGGADADELLRALGR